MYCAGSTVLDGENSRKQGMIPAAFERLIENLERLIVNILKDNSQYKIMELSAFRIRYT